MRSALPGIPSRTGCPPAVATHLVATERAREAAAVIGSSESISWRCRWGIVELPLCPTRPSRSPVATDCPASTATLPGTKWTKRGEYALAAQHDVVAEDARQAGRRERDRVDERVGDLADRVEPGSLLDAVDGPDDLAVERRMDRCAPRVALPRSSADEQAAPLTGRMGVEAGPIVDPDEVEGEALAEHVGPVARDPVGRAVDRDPVLAAQREVDHDRVGELGGRTPARGRRCGL